MGWVKYAVFYAAAKKGVKLGSTSFGGESVFDTMKKKAELKANKEKYNKALKKFKELSVGKVGTFEVEEYEDQNIKKTIIHTENGPMVKTEYIGLIVETDKYGIPIGGDNHKMIPGNLKVSYSGFFPFVVENEKQEMVFVEDATYSRDAKPQYRGREGWELNASFSAKTTLQSGEHIKDKELDDYKVFESVEKVFNAELENSKMINDEKTV